MPSHNDAGRRFQDKARKALHKWFGRPFGMEVDVSLPGRRSHRFDLVTAERDIFIECRLPNWKNLARCREAVDFLKSLPEENLRYLIVPAEQHVERRETFAKFFVRSNSVQLDSVNVLELNEQTGKLTCVHGRLSTDPSAMSLDDIEGLCRQLDRILDWVEEFRNREDSRADRVSRLRAEGKIPKATAFEMHTILKAASENGRRDAAALRAAWSTIVEWAKTEGCRAADIRAL